MSINKTNNVNQSEGETTALLVERLMWVKNY